jgi:integrase
MQRVSYQQGSVVRKPRSIGPKVWVFRYMDGDVQRSKILGTVDKFKTKAAARKEADKKLLEINERLAGIKVSGLCDRFTHEGEKKNSDLRPDTFATYKSFLKRVRAELGHWRVDELIRDIEAIENWVNGFETLGTPDRVIPDRMVKGKLIPGKVIPGTPPRPASKKTKQHVKAFLHLLFECAMKWKLIPMQRNPLKGKLIRIKGRKKRVRLANIITRDQWIALTTDSELCSHVRTMIFIAMLLGLRASEILGLRWEDFNMDTRIMHIHRSQVGKHTGDTKTEGSEEELPIHPDLYEVLEAWREEQIIDGVHTPINGWLFGSILTGRPFWRGTLQQDHLIPAGKKIGIPNLGWHDFRHTYRAMMRELKISLEEQQTLMRHEDIRTTLDYGGKTPAEAGRGANARVVEMLRKQA